MSKDEKVFRNAGRSNFILHIRGGIRAGFTEEDVFILSLAMHEDRRGFEKVFQLRGTLCPKV